MGQGGQLAPPLRGRSLPLRLQLAHRRRPAATRAALGLHARHSRHVWTTHARKKRQPRPSRLQLARRRRLSASRARPSGGEVAPQWPRTDDTWVALLCWLKNASPARHAFNSLAATHSIRLATARAALELVRAPLTPRLPCACRPTPLAHEDGLRRRRRKSRLPSSLGRLLGIRLGSLFGSLLDGRHSRAGLGLTRAPLTPRPTARAQPGPR